MTDVTISMESELDRKIEAIIRKVVKGDASPEDRAELEALCRKRASLMRSNSFTRSERLRRRRAAAIERVAV
jgi:hypothetical protein